MTPNPAMLYSESSPAMTQATHAAFDRADRDGSGGVNVDELSHFMQGGSSAGEVAQLHRAMDADGDGVVSREEWLAHEQQAATQDDPPPPATLEWLRRGQWISPREEDEEANDFALPAAARVGAAPSPACTSAGVAVAPSEARPSNSQPEDIVPPSSFTHERDSGCQTTISVSPSTAVRELALPPDAPRHSPGYHHSPSKLTWSDELPLANEREGGASRLPSRLPAIRTVERPFSLGKSDEEQSSEVATPRSVSLQVVSDDSGNLATAAVISKTLQFVPAAVASGPKRTFPRSRPILPHGAKQNLMNQRTPVGGSTVPGTWRPNDPELPHVPPSASPLDIDHALEI